MTHASYFLNITFYMSWQEAEINKNLSFNLDLDSSDMQRGHASEAAHRGGTR